MGAAEMNKYFYCYSYPLKNFFKKNGLMYITAAQNKSTEKTYWLFEESEKLNMLLQEWRLNR